MKLFKLKENTYVNLDKVAMVTLYLHGGKWLICLEFKGGVANTSFDTKEEAENCLAEIMKHNDI